MTDCSRFFLVVFHEKMCRVSFTYHFLKNSMLCSFSSQILLQQARWMTGWATGKVENCDCHPACDGLILFSINVFSLLVGSPLGTLCRIPGRPSRRLVPFSDDGLQNEWNGSFQVHQYLFPSKRSFVFVPKPIGQNIKRTIPIVIFVNQRPLWS